jgi:hypothetical protein
MTLGHVLAQMRTEIRLLRNNRNPRSLLLHNNWFQQWDLRTCVAKHTTGRHGRAHKVFFAHAMAWGTPKKQIITKRNWQNFSFYITKSCKCIHITDGKEIPEIAWRCTCCCGCMKDSPLWWDIPCSMILNVLLLADYIWDGHKSAIPSQGVINTGDGVWTIK